MALASAKVWGQQPLPYACPSRALDNAPALYTIPSDVTAGRPFSLCMRVERCFGPLPSFQVSLLVFVEGNEIRLPVTIGGFLDGCPTTISYARFNIPSITPGRYRLNYSQFDVSLIPMPPIHQSFEFDLLEPVSVPTLSKWGNVALLGLVFGLGTLTVWRRRGAQ
jgi:hypothetical protein